MTKTKTIELEDLKKQVEHFLDTTLDARTLSERDRDYYDGYQWTEEQINALQRRKQAPIVVNRVKPKVEGLKGLLEIRATDIKAFPRNEQDEGTAHAVTDSLRYVSDNNDFDTIKAECFEDKIIEGYCAAKVIAKNKDNGDIEIQIRKIDWNRFYFDPHSKRKDFLDARFMGEIIWMDEEEVLEIYPKAKLKLPEDEGNNIASDDTFEDSPKWFMNQDGRNRYRLTVHYFINKGVWNVAVFVGNEFLDKPKPSPYLDEEGKPANPIIADTAYIDRYNQRYGEVRGFISQQDEINHRRSKALHLLSSRQTLSKTGAVQDVAALKRELAKPDGHVQYNGDQGDFEILGTNDFAQGQIALYQDAKAEMDATSLNAQLSGERQSGDLSGKAIDKLQSAGSMEINSLYVGTSGWEKRIFRVVWERVKQFWTAEKWIRITQDQDNLRWVGLNTQITLQQQLEEIINDEEKPLEMKIGASAAFQTMMQAQDPRLQTVIEVRNSTADLDVDIKIEQGFDVVNIQQEQFQVLAQFAQSSQDIDIIELIELSQLRNKDELIEKIEQRRAQAAQAAGNVAQAEAQKVQVENAKTFADAQLTTKKAEQAAIENQLLMINGDSNPQVTV